MSDGLWETQQALYSRLTAASIVDGRIYDDVPDDPTYPFVEIGESLGTPQDADGFSGTEEFATLHIWSRHSGQGEAKQIMSEIHTELHKEALAVSGRSAIVWVQDVRTMDDADGITRHGIMRLKISTYA